MIDPNDKDLRRLLALETIANGILQGLLADEGGAEEVVRLTISEEGYQEFGQELVQTLDRLTKRTPEQVSAAYNTLEEDA